MWLGDYREDDTVYFCWDTNDAVGASITRATDGTVSVYKDSSTTQSTAGVTDTEDFDSLTGIHHCTIDLSADAFYTVGSDYIVVLSAATIDGQTVNAVLAHFSIENRFDNNAPVIVDLGFIKQSTAVQIVIGPFMSISTKEALTSLTVADITCGIIKHGSPPTNTAITLTASAGNNDMAHLANGQFRMELTTTDSNTLGPGSLTWTDADVFRPVVAKFFVLPANIYDSLIGGSDALQVDAIQLLGTAFATPTTAGVPEVDVTFWLGTAAATPTTAGVPEVDVTHWLGTAAATPTTAGVPEVDVTLWGGTAIATPPAVNVTQISGDAGAADVLEEVMQTVTKGSAITGTLTTASMTTDLASAQDDAFNGRQLQFSDDTATVALRLMQREITNYTGASKLVEFAALPTAPANGDTFTIT